MATRQAITLHEGNDEVLDLTVTPQTAGDDLTLVTVLELYLKPDECTPDDDESVLHLTSNGAGGIVITSHTAEQITAEAAIPAAALADPYDRWWHLDGLNAAGDRRTVLFGPVEVINL
jgi:hypothetical protein